MTASCGFYILLNNQNILENPFKLLLHGYNPEIIRIFTKTNKAEFIII